MSRTDVRYERLNHENFNSRSLDGFIRRQTVREVWRKIDGAWRLIPNEYEESWDPARRREIAADIARHMETDQSAFGAFSGDRLGRILCRVAFVCCVVGFCLCGAAIASLALGVEPLKLGRVTLNGLIRMETPVGLIPTCAAAIAGMILCAGEAILARFALRYFQRALADGTPFTLGGGRALKRLGILTICLPLGAQIIAEIVYAALTHGAAASLRLSSGGSVLLGALFIVSSLLCRLGAEQAARTDPS